MRKYYVGIDNGVTGTIAIINTEQNTVEIHKTPVLDSLNYTRKTQYIRRIDTELLKNILKPIKDANSTLVLLERPMVNPARFRASLSAIRALEATLIVLENLNLPYMYVDSKDWQRELLPKSNKKVSSSDLKKIAVNVAKRLFPNVHITDADALLMAEWARRKQL